MTHLGRPKDMRYLKSLFIPGSTLVLGSLETNALQAANSHVTVKDALRRI